MHWTGGQCESVANQFLPCSLSGIAILGRQIAAWILSKLTPFLKCGGSGRGVWGGGGIFGRRPKIYTCMSGCFFFTPPDIYIYIYSSACRTNPQGQKALRTAPRVRPAIPVRVLAPKPKSTFKYEQPYLYVSKHPSTLNLWREVPRWAGWKSFSESEFPKAPLWCQKLTRGVCNNIGGILVKVGGSGVKVRF